MQAKPLPRVWVEGFPALATLPLLSEADWKMFPLVPQHSGAPLSAVHYSLIGPINVMPGSALFSQHLHTRTWKPIFQFCLYFHGLMSWSLPWWVLWSGGSLMLLGSDYVLALSQRTRPVLWCLGRHRLWSYLVRSLLCVMCPACHCLHTTESDSACSMGLY